MLTGLGLATAATIANLATPFVILTCTVLFTAVVSSRFGILHKASDPTGPDESGIYPEAALAAEIEAEIARSERYHHEFALVLVALESEALRFDFSNEGRPALKDMTESLLRTTRQRVDKIFRCSGDQFALILPESGPDSVVGMVRRIRRLGSPLNSEGDTSARTVPLVFGATFYPSRATDADGLARRGRMALTLASKAPNNVHLDGAEAASLPPAETRRKAS